MFTFNKSSYKIEFNYKLIWFMYNFENNSNFKQVIESSIQDNLKYLSDCYLI